MDIACVSDLHGFLPEPAAMPAADLLVIAGDVCPVFGDHSPDAQATWLARSFRPWLDRLDHRTIVGIAGNHDLIAEADPAAMRDLPWLYLSDSAVEVDGLAVFGSPYSIVFQDWAFMEPEPELELRWRRIPATVDVLVTHGPPRMIGDLSSLVIAGRTSQHVGSDSLLRAVLERPSIKLHVFGHIHEAYGRTDVAGTAFLNASLVTADYRPLNPVQVVTI